MTPAEYDDIRVFISYTHDSQAHKIRVVKLAQRLREDGVDCRIDAFLNGNPEEGWPLWMEREIQKATFVLLVCTEIYFKRFQGNEDIGKGLGSAWEAHLTRDQIYAAQGRNRKFIPILFEDDSPEYIPEIIRYRTNWYRLMDDYLKLLRVLTKQPEVFPEPIGPRRKILPSETNYHPGEERLDNRFASSIRHHMSDLHSVVERLTKDQFRIIQQLRGQRRVRIKGCAGSGKTLIAAEKAIRLSEAGVNTLCLCHNPLLEEFLRNLTKGSGVQVSSFSSWINKLTHGKIGKSNNLWTHYDEPTTYALEVAFDTLTKHALNYEALIVDEGQDFRDEWWAVVEASLIDKNIGIFYIFHDDYQALLPYRASYPIENPVLDLSRNCRNAGQVYDIIRRIRPETPEPEPDLAEIGQIMMSSYQTGEEITAIQRCLRWIFDQDIGELPVILLDSLTSFEDSPFAVGDISISSKPVWRQEVLRKLERTIKLYDNRGLMTPPGAWDEISKRLENLSQQPLPTAEDVELVRSIARSFTVHKTIRRRIDDNPHICRAMRWKTHGDGVRLSRPYRAPLWGAEIIMHFERNDWHSDIPAPPSVQFTRYDKPLGNDALLVYQISDFKGLEADAVLFFFRGHSAITEQELYVAVSRARLALAVILERSLIPVLPKGVQGLVDAINAE